MPVFFLHLPSSYIFFFNDTATTEIYTLSLHDALPIYRLPRFPSDRFASPVSRVVPSASALPGRASPHRKTMSHFGQDRKSTRLNSSHLVISYAVFCLKKKKCNTFSFQEFNISVD